MHFPSRHSTMVVCLYSLAFLEKNTVLFCHRLDLGGAEVSTDGAFGSFFFASNDNPADKEQAQ